MIVLLILQSFASSAFECELPNFYAGNLNLTSENQYKDFIAKNEVFLLGIKTISVGTGWILILGLGHTKSCCLELVPLVLIPV